MSGHFTEKTRTVILARDEGACFVCGVHCYDVEGGFPRMAYSLQHRRARGMGGSSHPVTGSPVNGITVCGTATTGCHQRIEANPQWAEQQGYRVRQSADPASVPVHHINRGPIFLLPDLPAARWRLHLRGTGGVRMTDYSDDRYGMMRVHIASRRADLACAKYTRDKLRHWARTHGQANLASVRLKHDMAWHMAQHGLIDADGDLRGGFPA